MVAFASIVFPYLSKVIDEGEVSDPRAKIVVETLFGSRTIRFLIDSGADLTVLPLSRYGAWFRVDVDPQKRVAVGGIGDEKVYGYPGRIKIHLGNNSFWVRSLFLESSTAPLLGRLDIWDKYTLCFDNRRKESVLEELSKS